MKFTIEPVTTGFRAPGEDGANDKAIVLETLVCPGILWDDQGLIEVQQAQDLIAAAPEMLEALKEARTYFESTGFPTRASTMVEQAIAKAEGK